MVDVAAIVKAYDVVVSSRTSGTSRWPSFGAAFVQVDPPARRRRRRPRHAALLPGPVAAFADGRGRAGASTSTEIGLCSTDQLYFASGRAGPARRDVHRQPQPGPVQRHQDVPRGRRPVGQDTGLAEIRDLVEQWSDGGCPPAPDARPRARSREHGTCSTDYAAHLHGLVDLSRHPPAQGRRRRGQRHGRPHRPDRLRRPAARPRPDVLRAGRHLPQPRGQPARPGEPRRPAGEGPRASAPTSAWPSTATPTAASSSTSAASRSRPSAITALVAARELAKHAAARTVIHNLITSWSVPEVVREHGGTPVRTRVGHSFIKAEMAEHRRDLRRRALRALLLPGLLERRHRHARRAARPGRARRARTARCPTWSPTTTATRLRRDQLHRRRPGRPHRGASRPPYAGRTGVDPRRAGRPDRSPAPTGGSTSAPPTPSRCCGSTSRPRTTPPWQRSATRSSPRHRCIGEANRIEADRPGAAGDPGLPAPSRHLPRRPTRRDELVCTNAACGLALPGPRRHPGAADRRGAATPGRTRSAGSWDGRFDDAAGGTTAAALAAWPNTCCASWRWPAPRRPGRAGRGRGGAGQGSTPPTASARGPWWPPGRTPGWLRAVLEPVCPVPFVAWPGPGLPGWAGPLDLVVILRPPRGLGRGSAAAVRSGTAGLRSMLASSGGLPGGRGALGRGTPSGSRPSPTTSWPSAVAVLQALHQMELGPEVDHKAVASHAGRGGDRVLAQQRRGVQPGQGPGSGARRRAAAGVGRLRARRARRPPCGRVPPAGERPAGSGR